MTFDSPAFFLFLAAAGLLYRRLPRSARPAALTILSILYGATWSAWASALMLGATALAWRAGLELEGETPRAGVLPAALSVFLGVLALFKVLTLPGLPAEWRMAVPLGLSYYLFKLIGYLIEVYWGRMDAIKDFWTLSAFASFFPQIVSGPIQRAGDFARQLGEENPVDWAAVLGRLAFGYFQKDLADALAPLVSSAAAGTGAFSACAAMGLFSIRLYADFSGLTDLAIGAGLVFGVRGPENFARPYASRSVQEFWRRWHMSLSLWLADYLFMPLRMALRRFGDAGTAASLFAMLLAVGLWHGFQAHYAVFGALCGFYLAVSALTLGARDRFFNRRPRLSALRSFLAPAGVFVAMSIAFAFFRAPDLASAWALVRRAVSRPWGAASLGAGPAKVWTLAAAAALMETVHVLRLQGRLRERLGEVLESPAGGLCLGAAVAAVFVGCVLLRHLDAKPFIYFQF